MPAPTAPIPRRLLVVGFAGRGALLVRTAAIGALRGIPSLQIAPLRPSEALRIGTFYSAEKSVELARQLNLTAVLYGEVTEARRNYRVTVILANGEDGQTVGTIVFDGRSLAAARAKMRAQLWARLGPLIDQSASPGPSEPTRESVAETPPAPPSGPATRPVRDRPPGARDRGTGGAQGQRAPGALAAGAPAAAGAPSETEPASAPERPAGPQRGKTRAPGATPDTEGAPEEGAPEEGEAGTPGEPAPLPSTVRRRPADEEVVAGSAEARPPGPGRRCALAEVEPAGGVMLRRFNYRDEQRGALRGYALYRAPAGGVEGTVYPFANEACGLRSRLGLRLAYERMAPVTSRLADRQLGTQASAYQAELAVRLERGRFTVQPVVGYFVRQYSVDESVVPAAEYQAVGAGVDAAVRIGPVTIELGGGVRRLLGTGVLESAAWFPGLSTFAASGRGRLGVAVNEWIDVLAGGSLEYYSFTFKIDPNGLYPNGVASGAYDLYVQGMVGVRFRLGLRGRSSGAAAP